MISSKVRPVRLLTQLRNIGKLRRERSERGSVLICFSEISCYFFISLVIRFDCEMLKKKIFEQCQSRGTWTIKFH